MEKIILYGLCILLCSCANRNLHRFSYGAFQHSPEKDLTSKFGLRQALVLFGRKTIVDCINQNDTSSWVSLTPYAKVESTDEGFYYCALSNLHYSSCRFAWGDPPRPLVYLDSKYRIKFILTLNCQDNRRILRSVSPELMEQLRLENKLDSTVLRLR